MTTIDVRQQQLSLDGWQFGGQWFPEIACPDGLGRVHHWEQASIYWHPRVGAHAVPASIRAKYVDMGGPDSSLGYPIWSEPDRVVFERGTITAQHVATPLSVLFYNTALMYPVVLAEEIRGGAEVAGIPGKDLSYMVNWIIQQLRACGADVVGLCEVYSEHTPCSSVIFAGVEDIYPHLLAGPTDPASVESGGLMLLSKYPLEQPSVPLIYRDTKLPDGLSAKGIIHGRISLASGPLDLFLTHLQDDDEVALRQLQLAARYVDACRDHRGPAILLGDLNVERHKLLVRLETATRIANDRYAPGPHDRAQLDAIPVEPGIPGYTLDDGNNFKNDIPGAPAQRLGKSGRQVDYALCWPGIETSLEVAEYKTVAWVDDNGRDLSDHQGIRLKITQTTTCKVDVLCPVGRVEMTLARAMVNDLTGVQLFGTDILGPDNIDFGLRYSATDQTGEIWAGTTVDFSEGVSAAPPSPISTVVPGNSGVSFIVELREIDWITADVSMVSPLTSISREDLLLLAPDQAIFRAVRVVNTDESGEYLATVSLALAPDPSVDRRAGWPVPTMHRVFTGALGSGQLGVGARTCAVAGDRHTTHWFGLRADGAMQYSKVGPASIATTTLPEQWRSRPCAIARSADEVDLFGLGPHRQMYWLRKSRRPRRSKSADGAGWAPVVDLGHQFASAPTVVSWGPDRTDVFAVDTEGRVMYNTRVGWEWSGWRDIMANASLDPRVLENNIAVVPKLRNSPSASELESKAVGSISKASEIPSKAVKKALAGLIDAIEPHHRGATGAVDRRNARLDDGQVLSNREVVKQDGLVAVSWGRGRIDLFQRTSGGRLLHCYYDGVWRKWHPIAAGVAGSPHAVSWGPGHISVFARTTNHQLSHWCYRDGWTVETLGGKLAADPIVVSTTERSLDCIVRDAEGIARHRGFDGTRWTDWRPVDELVNNSSVAVSLVSGHIDLLTLHDETLRQRTTRLGR